MFMQTIFVKTFITIFLQLVHLFLQPKFFEKNVPKYIQLSVLIITSSFKLYSGSSIDIRFISKIKLFLLQLISILFSLPQTLTLTRSSTSTRVYFDYYLSVDDGCEKSDARF